MTSSQRDATENEKI